MLINSQLNSEVFFMKLQLADPNEKGLIEKIFSRDKKDTQSSVKKSTSTVTEDAVDFALKHSIKQAQKQMYSTDCDEFFCAKKELITQAIKAKVSLTDIVKALNVNGSYNVTSQKLSKWMKGQGIKRRVHRRAKRAN